MRKLKKIFLFSVLISLISLAFVGCQSEDSDDEEDDGYNTLYGYKYNISDEDRGNVDIWVLVPDVVSYKEYMYQPSRGIFMIIATAGYIDNAISKLYAGIESTDKGEGTFTEAKVDYLYRISNDEQVALYIPVGTKMVVYFYKYD